MNEKFHYLINFLFVPALSPVCPRFVPGTFPAQTLAVPCFLNLSPVSPAFFDSWGEGFARWHKKTARPGDGGAAGVGVAGGVSGGALGQFNHVPGAAGVQVIGPCLHHGSALL